MCANLANMWKDEHGKTLEQYRHPSLAVDVALLTVIWADRRGQLAVLLHQPESGFAAGQWCLPGVMVGIDELLAAAAARALHVKGGVDGARPRQLQVFDALDRDERGRVVSVAHADVLPERRLQLTGPRILAPLRGARVQLPGGQRRLPYDHDAIVASAGAWVRSRYERRADPFHLLGTEFTLSDLQKVHEAVHGLALPKDTFRRTFSEYLVPTGAERTGAVGRPAAVYRHMTREERRAHRAQRELRRGATRRS